MRDNDYDSGWFLKAPYVANNMHFRGHSYASLQALLTSIRGAIERRVQDIFPYLMLQPTIPERKEAKVIMHNGVCQYFSKHSSKCLRPEEETQVAEFFKFAKSAYDALAESIPQCITNRPGLVRIDIMKLECRGVKRLVVNEVEGIDSNYSGSGDQEHSSGTFIENFWASVIDDKLNNLLS